MLASPDDIVTALRDYRCEVVEWPGWRTRGRPYSFNPYAQAWHHDAFGEPFGDLEAAKYMTERGRPDLPPPLCNGAIGNHGTVFLCAYGNANHAGRNRASVLYRLRDGQAPMGWARDQPYEKDTIVGNSHLWGWECRNAGTGRDPWDQLDVMIRAGAALADACGWPPYASAGHGELTTRKIDPVGFDMHGFRRAIALTIAAHNTPGPSPDEEEDDMLAAAFAAIDAAYEEAGYEPSKSRGQARSKWYAEARAKYLAGGDPWDAVRSCREQLPGVPVEPVWPS